MAFSEEKTSWLFFREKIHVTFDMPGRDVNSYHLVGQRAFGLSRGEEEELVGIFWLQIHVTFDMLDRDVNSFHLVGEVEGFFWRQIHVTF